MNTGANLALEDRPPVAASEAVEYPWLMSTGIFRSIDREEWSDHSHAEHCLIWSESGAISVECDGQVWMAALGLGIWVPAGTVHRIMADGGSLLSVTYFNASRTSVSWTGVTAIGLTGVVRELMLCNKTVAMPTERRLRLQALTVDLLTPVETASLTIRLPTHPMLRQVADAIIDNPADARTSEDWADELRISARTLARGFVRETGSTLTQWRILVRMRSAIIDIGAGVPVAAVARRLGYANRSTFIDLFRRTTGHAPTAYFASLRRNAQANEGRPLETA